MKKSSATTILILSIGLISAPVLARQAAVSDYVGYMRTADSSAEYIWHECGADNPARHVSQRHSADNSTTEHARIGQNADDRESRRIGKLLWKSDYFQGNYSKWSNAKMLEWPLLWKIGHVQGDLEWPLLWKIGYVQYGRATVN